MTTIDLNCDLGEGFGVWRLGDDEALLSLVTSANVACGFHAGDPSTLRRVTAIAAERGVAVGAQVSYRDLAGFGRRPMDVPAAELADEIVYQIGALEGFCRIAGTRVRYVKPHGALYNRIVTDEVQAGAVVEAVWSYDKSLPVLGLPGSAFLRVAAARDLTAVPEAFADREYTPAGTLVPRGSPGAVLEDPKEVVRRCLRLVQDGKVSDVDGGVVAVRARSLCVHGDTPGAVDLARRIRAALTDADICVRPFVAP